MGTRGHRRLLMEGKTPEEIENLREAARVVSEVHLVLRDQVKAGVETGELDRIAEECIRDNEAEPAFKGYVMQPDVQPYPASLCVSINEVVVHGIPDSRVLEEGDIVSLDVGVRKNGFHGDCACTYGVGEISEENQRLMDVTLESLHRGIEQAVVGNWTYDIGRAVQRCVEDEGFSVVRELVGHGIGQLLHEDPAVPNFVPNPFVRHHFRNQRLIEGMVLCIEPMVNTGTYKVATLPDEWTIVTQDKKASAHFEHMVVVADGEPEVLTTHIPERRLVS